MAGLGDDCCSTVWVGGLSLVCWLIWLSCVLFWFWLGCELIVLRLFACFLWQGLVGLVVLVWLLGFCGVCLVAAGCAFWFSVLVWCLLVCLIMVCINSVDLIFFIFYLLVD